MSIILPTEKVKSTKKNPRITLLYGPPKVGKTSALAELDNCLIIDIEEGSEYVDALKIQAYSWREVYEIGQEILKAGKPYKYIALDTATQLVLWAEGLAKQLYLNHPSCAKKYKTNPELLESILFLTGDKEGSYGPGYEWLRIAYMKCFNYLLTLSDHLILIAHIKDKQLVNKDDTVVAAADLSLTGKIKQMTCSKADAVGFMYRQTIGAKDGKPVSQMRVSFYSGLDILSCARCEHLAGQDFEFDPKNNKEDWKKIFIDE